MRSAKLSGMGSARVNEVGRRVRALRFGLASAVLLTFAAVTSIPSVARADETSRMNLDWAKLADAIRDGGIALFPREGYATGYATGYKNGTLRQDPERWVGVTPHPSLVA